MSRSAIQPKRSSAMRTMKERPNHDANARSGAVSSVCTWAPLPPKCFMTRHVRFGHWLTSRWMASRAAHLTNVLCAVDLDDTGVHTLRYAANFARRIGARFTIAHAVPAVETRPEAYMDADFRADLIEAARGRLAEMQALAGCEAVVCVGSGNIARFVSHAAESHKAGLVIIGVAVTASLAACEPMTTLLSGNVNARF